MKTLILIIISISLITCKTTRKNTTSIKTVEKNSLSQENDTIIVKLDSTFFDNTEKSDYFNITSYQLKKNVLELFIMYSGGCKKHNFKVIGSTAIAKSYPPIRNLKIIHNANNDLCRSMINDTLKINLKNLIHSKKEGSKIYLNFQKINNRILYEYKK